MVKLTSTRRWQLFFGVVLVLGVVYLLYHRMTPRGTVATGTRLTLQLNGGPLDCAFFGPTNGSNPLGLVVLGTGDGGWSYWEENTAISLSNHGYAVMGWDCRKYADSRRYTHSDLVNGFKAATEAGSKECGSNDLPVWYGGWSTGAEQSVAAAGSSNRPKQLVGLLLAAPGSRGRFGINTSDLLGITPSGEDSFALKDWADQLDGLHVAQFVAGLDPLDDTQWLESLKTPTKQFLLPNALHDMGGAGEEFQKNLLEAIHWTLLNPQSVKHDKMSGQSMTKPVTLRQIQANP
jgi:hypothetical protein